VSTGLYRGVSGLAFGPGLYRGFEGLSGDVVIPPPPPLALGDLTDVTLTSPADGEELVFDGSKWINY
jgi:hypothetical protein